MHSLGRCWKPKNEISSKRNAIRTLRIRFLTKSTKVWRKRRERRQRYFMSSILAWWKPTSHWLRLRGANVKSKSVMKISWPLCTSRHSLSLVRTPLAKWERSCDSSAWKKNVLGLLKRFGRKMLAQNKINLLNCLALQRSTTDHNTCQGWRNLACRKRRQQPMPCKLHSSVTRKNWKNAKTNVSRSLTNSTEK